MFDAAAGEFRRRALAHAQFVSALHFPKDIAKGFVAIVPDGVTVIRLVGRPIDRLIVLNRRDAD
jgi:hypothetical protein